MFDGAISCSLAWVDWIVRTATMLSKLEDNETIFNSLHTAGQF